MDGTGRDGAGALFYCFRFLFQLDNTGGLGGGVVLGAFGEFGRELVVGGFDGESGGADETGVGMRDIPVGEPVVADALEGLGEFGVADPEGRVAGGGALDAGDGEVLGVDPDSALEQEFLLLFWSCDEDVAEAAFDGGRAFEGKGVIAGADGGLVAGGFGFGLGDTAEDVVG